MQGAPRRPRAPVDGVLLLDKPRGISSQTAVTRVKGLFGAAKAGHTGTLDPMATGLLPIAFGEATKFSGVLLDATKRYAATIRLGTTTATGDLEGEVTAHAEVRFDRAQLEAVLARFRGEMMQTPPMYSALKHQGKPLYDYARKGIEIERAPRAVRISALEIEGYDAPDLLVDVECSKGTYIRVLAEDIGLALGCGACLAALRRTGTGHFDVGRAVDFDRLGRMTDAERLECLLPPDALLMQLPERQLDAAEVASISRGQEIPHVVGSPALVRLYGPDRAFVGIGEAAAGSLRPRRLIATGIAKG